MDLTPPEPSNIVALNGSVEQQLEITRKAMERQHKCSGRHKQITVDSERRTLTCRDCGYIVDPFDYVESWAIEGERRMLELDNIKVKTRIAWCEHATLEKKVKNVRQQLKRLGDPQTLDERNVFDRMKWNSHNPNVEEELRLIEGGLKKA